MKDNDKQLMVEIRRVVQSLSSTAVVLSQLEPLSAHQNLADSDYLTFARKIATNPVTGQDHLDENIKYGKLRDMMMLDFRRKPQHVYGNWSFGDSPGDTSRIFLNPSTVGNWSYTNSNTGNKSAITLKFYREYVEDMVDKLSAMYYGTSNRMPSVVGEVVTTLNYIGDFKNYAATNRLNNFQGPSDSKTTWKMPYVEGGRSYHGLILAAVGDAETNNFTRYGDCAKSGTAETSCRINFNCPDSAATGHNLSVSYGSVNVQDNGNDGTYGSYTSLIKPRYFPVHTHKFEADMVSFQMVFRVRGTVAPLACTGSGLQSDHMCAEGEGNKGLHYTGTIGTLTPLKMTGSVTWSTKNSYGSAIKIDEGDIRKPDGGRISGRSAASYHHNVPPVIYVQFWQRVT